MMQFIQLLFMTMPIFAPQLSTAPSLQAEGSKDVAIAVTVSFGGKPVIGLPILARAPEGVANRVVDSRGVTDDGGNCVLNIPVSGAKREVVVFPAPAPRQDLINAEYVRDLDRQDAEVAKYAFERLYSVVLPAGSTSCRLDISALPARVLHLRAVGRDGVSSKAWILSRDVVLSRQTKTRENGVVELAGLSKVRASVVYVKFPSGAVSRVVVPPGDETAELGDVVEPPNSGVAAVTVTLNWPKARVWEAEQARPGATLVSVDGKTILSLFSKPTAQPEGAPKQVAARIAEGDYLVVPGMFTAIPAQTAVIDRALRGDVAALAWLPRLHASSTTAAKVVVDVERVLDQLDAEWREGGLPAGAPSLK